MDTITISVQKIAETPPRMFSTVSGIPWSGTEGFLRRVQRACAEVPVNDAQRQERERGCRLAQVLSVMGHAGGVVRRREARSMGHADGDPGGI